MLALHSQFHFGRHGRDGGYEVETAHGRARKRGENGIEAATVLVRESNVLDSAYTWLSGLVFKVYGKARKRLSFPGYWNTGAHFDVFSLSCTTKRDSNHASIV